jgi:hypothetical protein
VFVGQLPSARAFNILSIVGIAVVLVIMAIGLATKNYTFKSQEARPPVEELPAL